MKKMLLAATLLAALLMINAAAAQDATPDATTGVSSEATPDATNAPAIESTAETTAAPTSASTTEATAEATEPPGALAEFPGAGSYTVRQNYPDGQRTYRVYIPRSYAKDGDPLPLVIVMHGAGGDGASIESYVGFNALADTENFVVVYPNGVNHAWNDGRQGDPRVGNINDVQFLGDIVIFMGRSLHIDAKRAYAAGYSMGGMMAYRLGCELPNRFAAVASVASTMPEYLIDHCDGSAPIPVLVFAGTDDPVMPWVGIRGAYLSAGQTIGYWGNHNLCTGDFAVEGLPDADPADHTLVMRQALTQCAADVTLYGVYWGGHTWPGHPINVSGLGPTTDDIDATTILWEFFKAHAKAS